MTQTLSNYYETLCLIADEAVYHSRGRLGMAKSVYVDYDAKVGKKSQTLNIDIPSDTSSTSSFAGTITATDAASSKSAITLSNHEYVARDFSDAEMANFFTDPQKLLNLYIYKDVEAICKKVETTIIDHHKNILATVGAVGTSMSAATAISGRTALENAKVINSDRNFLVSTADAAVLLTLQQFANATGQINSENLKSGELPFVYGMQFRESQYTPVLTVPDASGAVNNGAGYAAESVTITMDGYSGTAPAEGQLVKFANHATIYTVDSGSTTTSLKIKNPRTAGVLRTGLTSAVVDDEAITFLNPNNINIAYQKNAFAVAARPLKPNMNDNSFISFTQVDPDIGIPISISIFRTDNSLIRVLTESLWGTQTVSERLAVKVIT